MTTHYKLSVLAVSLLLYGLLTVLFLQKEDSRLNYLEKRISYLEENMASDLEADYAKWRCTQFLDERCVQYTERNQND